MNYWQYADQPKRNRWHRGDRQRSKDEALASQGQQLSLFDQPLQNQECANCGVRFTELSACPNCGWFPGATEQPQHEVTEQEFENWLDEWD